MRKNEARWIEERERWQINVQKNGERKTFTSKTPGKKGKAEAERKAERWLEDSTSAENARVGTLLDEYKKYLESCTSKSHYNQYFSSIENHIRPVIGMKRINALTEGDLQDVINIAYAKHNLADKTLHNIRACISNFMKYCRKHGKTRLHPEDLTIPKGAKKSEKTVLQPDGLKKLFSVSTTRYNGKIIEDWFIHAYRFAVLTGVRPGELRGIQDRKDVRGNKVTLRRSINVYDEETTGKNDNARRTFVLSARAMSEVEAQRAMLRQHGILSPYLFPDKDGEPVSYSLFYDAWERFCKSNDIEYVSLYEMMRHTFVSVNKEMPEGLKKPTMGHSRDMDTDGTYGHIMEGDMERAAEYIERAFDKVLEEKKTAEK